jgi:hypothetical protein
MLVVNLYSDHLLPPEPNHAVRPAEELWYATKVRAALYERAAKAVGLTPSEYREFRLALLDGKSVHVRLPRRIDVMSGAHAGRVYAVRNAIIRPTSDGWPTGLRVRLGDGTEVYVPDLCGNLSVNHPLRVAVLPAASHRPPRYTMALATTPLEQPVYVQAPEVPTTPTIAEAVPKSGSPLCGWWCFALPVGGALAGLVHGSPPQSVPPPSVPPCSAGSNAVFACAK